MHRVIRPSSPIMTLYLLDKLEAGHLKLDTPLNVSAYAASRPPTNSASSPARRFKVEDALRGLVTRSANNAATVIAEALQRQRGFGPADDPQGSTHFGMSNTIYINASGLPADLQITTAPDQALQPRHPASLPRLLRLFRHHCAYYRGKEIRNHDALFGNVKGVDGIETSYARASGYNLVCSR